MEIRDFMIYEIKGRIRGRYPIFQKHQVCLLARLPLSQWNNGSDTFAKTKIEIIIKLQVLETEYSGSVESIPCLLMGWPLKSPDHQQAWYWLWQHAVSTSHTELTGWKQNCHIKQSYWNLDTCCCTFVQWGLIYVGWLVERYQYSYLYIICSHYSKLKRASIFHWKHICARTHLCMCLCVCLRVSKAILRWFLK